MSIRSSTCEAGSSIPGENTATADVFVRDRLPIDTATLGFRSSFGLQDSEEGGFALLDLLPGSEAERLLQWVRLRSARVLRGEAATPIMETSGEAQLATPQGRTGHVLRVCFPPPEAESDYRVSINIQRSRRRPTRRGSLGTPPIAEAQVLGRPSAAGVAKL